MSISFSFACFETEKSLPAGAGAGAEVDSAGFAPNNEGVEVAGVLEVSAGLAPKRDGAEVVGAEHTNLG